MLASVWVSGFVQHSGNWGVSSAVSLSTHASAFTAALSSAQHGQAVISHQVAIMSPTFTAKINVAHQITLSYCAAPSVETGSKSLSLCVCFAWHVLLELIWLQFELDLHSLAVCIKSFFTHNCKDLRNWRLILVRARKWNDMGSVTKPQESFKKKSISCSRHYLTFNHQLLLLISGSLSRRSILTPKWSWQTAVPPLRPCPH